MLISENLPQVIVVVLLLAFSAFFSGSETALFSLSRSAVAAMKKGGRREGMVASMLEKPRMLLVTILFGNLLVNIANTSVVTVLAIKLFGEKGVGYSMITMTCLILIFGEITPKSLALKHARSLSVAIAPLLRFFMIIFYPIRTVLGWIADFAVEKSRALFGERSEEYGSFELATAVEMGHSSGLFDEFEREVLTNLFLFAETTVKEIFRPRGEVFSLDVETSLQEAVIQVRSRGYSRIPLYEASPDRIVGILLAKEMLRYSRDERIELRDIMREVIFVPESKLIRDLLGELISAGQHVVIVIDEHGSYTGMVTLEDILEEIFGEIRDRREPFVKEYNITSENRIVVEGTMRLEDINSIFGTELDSEEVETAAGYLTEMIGKIPREGETFVLGNLRFLVISADRTRVNKIGIERIPGERKDDELD